ncbi:MAG: hypothetical protein WD872_16090 [Pirellulaceae bacterium]
MLGNQLAQPPLRTDANFGGINFHLLVLGDPWDRPPRHALDLPPLWADTWDGEWNLMTGDMLTREEALADVAANNQKSLAQAKGATQLSWWLAFEVGELGETSFVLVEHGAAATFHLHTSLTLVHPTAAEIKRLTAKPTKAKRAKEAK